MNAETGSGLSQPVAGLLIVVFLVLGAGAFVALEGVAAYLVAAACVLGLLVVAARAVRGSQ